MSEFTQILARAQDGDAQASKDLLPLVYGELRQVAAAKMAREAPGQTLQPTALVHEAWLRLVDQDQAAFDHRRQFYALAAQMMRRILIDHARTLNASKRGGGAIVAPLDDNVPAADARLVDLLALDEALQALARISPRQARVIELRYFGGLNVEEMADVLEVSPATVSRDQRAAEAWLAHVLSSGVA